MFAFLKKDLDRSILKNKLWFDYVIDCYVILVVSTVMIICDYLSFKMKTIKFNNWFISHFLKRVNVKLSLFFLMNQKFRFFFFNQTKTKQVAI